MHHKTYIRDYTEQILLITLVECHGIVVVGRHKDLRTSTLSQYLLLLVERISYRDTILLQHQFIYSGQIGRIVANRVLDKQNSLNTHIEDIVLGIHTILQQLDNRNNQVGRVIPAEDVVDARGITLLNLAINLLREVGQKHHRCCCTALLHLA